MKKIIAMLLLVAMLFTLAACGSEEAAASSAAAASAAATGDQPYAGTSIRVILASHDWTTAIESRLGEFEEALKDQLIA